MAIKDNNNIISSYSVSYCVCSRVTEHKQIFYYFVSISLRIISFFAYDKYLNVANNIPLYYYHERGMF